MFFRGEREQTDTSAPPNFQENHLGRGDSVRLTTELSFTRQPSDVAICLSRVMMRRRCGGITVTTKVLVTSNLIRIQQRASFQMRRPVGTDKHLTEVLTR